MTTHTTSSIQKPMKKLHNLNYHGDDTRNVYRHILKFEYISHENYLNTLFFLNLGRISAPEKEGFHLSHCLQTYRFSPRDLTTDRQWLIQGKCFPSTKVPMSNSMPSRNTSQTGKQENP